MAIFYTEVLKKVLVFVLLYTFLFLPPSSNAVILAEHKILIKQA